VAYTGTWLKQKRFQIGYSLRQYRKDVEIRKANGLATALQADKTKKSFWQKVNNENRSSSLPTLVGGANGGSEIVKMWRDNFKGILNSENSFQWDCRVCRTQHRLQGELSESWNARVFICFVDITPSKAALEQSSRASLYFCRALAVCRWFSAFFFSVNCICALFTACAQICCKTWRNRLVWNQYITIPKEKIWGDMAYYITTVWKSVGGARTRVPHLIALMVHGSGVQRSGDARGDLLDCMPPLTNSSIEQWRMVVIVTGYMSIVTSQHDVILPFANQRFAEVCWHNMHIILHAPSLLVVVQFVTVMNVNYQRSKLGDRWKIEHSTLIQSNYNNCENLVKTRE